MRALLLLLLLLPAVHAETGSWHGSLVGPSVAADAQVLEATVVAVRIPLDEGTEASSWLLEGEHLEAVTRVEVSDPRNPPDPTDLPSVLEPRQHEERGTHRDFVARVTRSGPGVVHIFPHPEGGALLERSIGVVELVPSGDDVVDPGNRASAHQRPHNTSRAVLVQDHQPPLQYVVRGDLLLDVSNMDWTVEAGGSTRYTSGDRREPVAAQDTDGLLPPGREEHRHLFLYVRNGTLRLPGQGIQPDLYLDHVRIESQRTELRAATGTLSAGTASLDLVGETAEFRGRNHLWGLRSDGRLLEYGASSGDGTVLVGGQRHDAPVARADPAAPAVVPEGRDPMAAALLLLPLVAVGLARPPFWLVAAALRVRMRHFAARHAPRFLDSDHAPQAVLLGSVAMLGLGRFAAARGFLAGVPVEARPPGGTWWYLQAHASAGAGEDDEAADHLERCLGAAPEHGPQVLANPVLRRVVGARPKRFGKLLPGLSVPLP